MSKRKSIIILASTLVLWIGYSVWAQQPMSLSAVSGSALGAPANYGTSPGAVLVPGVNAFVTNTPTVSVSTWAAGVLGAMANYGTSPGTVLVPGVNAFITNTPTVSVPTWAGGTLGAMANYGTSPGAVLTPGVNAFITNTPAFTIQPSTSATFAYTTARATTSTSTFATLKGSAGNLYGVDIFNAGTAPCYLIFYNNAAPTIGTTASVQVFGVQAGVAKTLPPGVIALANFGTGITYAATTTDGGAGVCATAMSVNFWYQ